MNEQLQKIHLSQIVVPEIFQKYRPELFDSAGSPKFDNDLIAFAETIEREGLLQPVFLRDLGNETFEIVFGLRRFRAHEYLASVGKKQFSSIVARVIHKLSDVSSLVKAHIENEHRKSPTFAALCVTAFQLAEGGMDPSKIAEMLAEPSSTIRSALATWRRATPEVQRALAEGKITRYEASELAKRPKADQNAALEALLASEDRAPEAEDRIERAVRRRKAAKLPPPSSAEGDDEGSTLPTEKLKKKDFVAAATYVLVAEQNPVSKAVSDAFLVAAGKMELREFLLSHFRDDTDVLTAFGVSRPRGLPPKRQSLFTRAST